MTQFSERYKRLGQILSYKLRDENFEIYQDRVKKAKSMTLKEYYELPRNPNYSPELQKLDDERFELFNNMTSEQLQVLDRFVLSMLDLSAFIFLKEVEENLFNNESIGLTIDGVNVEVLTKELLSGTLFGEYFLWVEQFSKFGKVQH